MLVSWSAAELERSPASNPLTPHRIFQVHLLTDTITVVYQALTLYLGSSMARAPFQVLVLPYRQRLDGTYQFAVFRRADDGNWQGIAGGGEADETPLQAAQREAREEAGIPAVAAFLPLDTVTSIAVTCFSDTTHWGDHRYVIPEYTFGVEIRSHPLRVSPEHTTVVWRSYEQAKQLLRYDSNRVALWELHQKVRGFGPREGQDSP